MTSVSASHFMLTPTKSVKKRPPGLRLSPSPSEQKLSALPTELSPPPPPQKKLIKRNEIIKIKIKRHSQSYQQERRST